MANVIVTMKVMLESPETDAKKVEQDVIAKVKEFNQGKDIKSSVQPVAFGLKAVEVMFVLDEANGSTDKLEEEINSLEGVESVEVTDVRRAVG